ncbi:S41 family peptidase [Aquimarina aggregata]|uniref:S41 family peptidase n=1 Tax=Aquimarina aggregata TaxID=1642818 RepID=UPI002491E736|nr:S41 family peptidase [Aquimarina aggregata]
MKVTFYILVFYCFVSCSEKKSNASTLSYGLEKTFLKDKNTTNPLIKGIWKSIGNGYYLEARQDSILLYSYTTNFCYKEKNDYIEGLLHSQSQFALRGDTLGIYLTDFGDKTQTLQTKKDFIKVDRLPENTIDFSKLTTLSPQKLFKLYIETLQENYAFSKRRGLDWKSLFNGYKDSLTHTNEALFNTMGKIATLTKDQHTKKVISESGKTLQYRITPSAEVVKEAFKKQSEIKNLNEYFGLFFETNYKNISDSLLHGNGIKVLNDKLEWGDLTKHIGYINIHSFTGFLNREHTRKQQIDSLNVHMQKIINTFQDKEAIVIDISFNFGGYDATALTIASYFTDATVFSHKSQVYDNGMFYDEDDVFIFPANSLTFKKPVYVLMTDISRSAAESFAVMMGVLPNVKLVGTNTLGTLSSMLGKSIGDFYTTYSNQRLVDESDQFFEVYGVEPDIKLQVFKKENIFQSHKTSVRDLIQIIEETH